MFSKFLNKIVYSNEFVAESKKINKLIIIQVVFLNIQLMKRQQTKTCIFRQN